MTEESTLVGRIEYRINDELGGDATVAQIIVYVLDAIREPTDATLREIGTAALAGGELSYLPLPVARSIVSGYIDAIIKREVS